MPHPNYAAQSQLATRFFIRYATIISVVLLFFIVVFYQHSVINSNIVNRSDKDRQHDESLRHHAAVAAAASHRHFHERPNPERFQLAALKHAIMRHRMHHLQYSPPYQPKRKGIYFSVRKTSPILRRLGLTGLNHCVKDAQSVRDVQFVTAVSHLRFDESLDMISSVHTQFPNRTLVVFDIGLKMDEITQLKRLCNVHYRKFVFVGYPAYTRLISRFYWKPLVLQTALNEYGAILWLESSSRVVMNSAMLGRAVQLAKQTGVMIFGGKHVYSTLTVTHPEVYRYLPTDPLRIKTSGQMQTAPIILINTEFVRDHIMLWFVLCGLERHCMAPLRARRKCANLQRNQHAYKSRYMHCHRYDQSVLNILLKNAFDFNSAKYLNRKLKLVRLKRGHDPKKYKVNFCNATTTVKH